MATMLDAAQVSEAKNILASVGYCDAFTEDVALTLQQMGGAREQQSLLRSVERENNDCGTTISPPRGANDITVAPHREEKAVERSGDGDRQLFTALLNERPGVSTCSAQGRPSTAINPAGKRRYPGRGRKPNREYLHQRPFYSNGGVVEEATSQRAVDAYPRAVRYVDSAEVPHASSGKNAVVKDVVTIPTGVVTAKGRQCASPYLTLGDYMNPQARLERHLKRYEKGLKTLYANRYDENGQDELLADEEDDEVHCAKENDPRSNPSGAYEAAENNLAFFYGDRSHRPLMPEMPLRPASVLVNQRSANTIYNFTGDSRYKYRGGLGVPLCAVLGPDGSTLRQRADPVRRGQQMREMWEKDKFLAQHCRNKDRLFMI